MLDSKEDVSEYIKSKITCDASCFLCLSCPEASRGMKERDCIIQRNYSSMFETFYNLVCCNKDGIDREITRMLFIEAKHAVEGTSDQRKEYLNSLIKARPILYGKDPGSSDTSVDEIEITISGLEEIKEGE